MKEPNSEAILNRRNNLSLDNGEHHLDLKMSLEVRNRRKELQLGKERRRCFESAEREWKGEFREEAWEVLALIYEGRIFRDRKKSGRLDL